MESYLTIFDNIAVRIGIILLIFYVAKQLIRPLAWVLFHVRHATPQLLHKKRLVTILGFIDSIATIVLWVVTIIVILVQFHINITALLTGAGVVGVIAGISFQSTLKNFAISFSLLLSGFYEVGDTVTLAGVSGVVKEINFQNTVLQGEDDAIHFVPNSEIKVITNFSHKK
ncbi:MAG: mechanosensitive ion channel [Patescibacteria group bacterium]|nr:mechanosensitive ion channel [Patescibacteria group bacterium]MDE2437861.1 mechanosensitive ion channel [Patescibacteria group bacterium]